MKRWIPMLTLALLLTACTDQPRQEPQIRAVYEAAVYDLALPEAMNYELAGRAGLTVALPFFNNGDDGENNVHGGTALYAMGLEGQTAAGALITGLERPGELLGLDGEQGIWIYDGQLRRISPAGEETLAIAPPGPLWQSGVFGFGDDGTYTYFLCWLREPDESRILVYDRAGALVFSQELTAYCQGTAGYLPQEAEWAEELEGREEDHLLSMLFAEGPVDSMGLADLRKGGVCLYIIRKSPIDGERYCILCTLGADFTPEPVMYYEIENEAGIPYGLPMPSPEDAYDLLSPQKDALYGINLEAGTMTPLAGWSQLDTGPSWFTGWSNSVGLGPEGRVWSLEWDRNREGYVIRAVGPIGT